MKKVLRFRFEIIITLLVEVLFTIITFFMFVLAETTMQLLLTFIMICLTIAIPFIVYVSLEKVRRSLLKRVK